MMELVNNGLGVNGLKLVFHRTLRLPEDSKLHRLPPSLGAFPIKRVEDYQDKVPAAWREHGGVFLPLYQREAMWISFEPPAGGTPRALKIAAGKINAVSGDPWSETLTPGPKQDYMVVPPQPWLDGFCVGKGEIRQFIAQPLGLGYTVEAQVTGEETFGGLQLVVYRPKAGGPADHVLRSLLRGGGAVGQSLGGADPGGIFMVGGYAEPGNYISETLDSFAITDASANAGGGVRSMGGQQVNCTRRSTRLRASMPETTKRREMGLAQGGRMQQKIYDDPYGVDAWDTATSTIERVFVHIVNAELWEAITGDAPPMTPVSAQTYSDHGLPWFDLYDSDRSAVEGSAKLANLKTVSQLDAEHGFKGQQDDTSIASHAHAPNTVKDGTW